MVQSHQCGNTNLMADSGASIHITPDRSDLSEYEVIEEDISLDTASKTTKPLHVKGKGAMFLTISKNHRGQELVPCLLCNRGLTLIFICGNPTKPRTCAPRQQVSIRV